MLTGDDASAIDMQKIEKECGSEWPDASRFDAATSKAGTSGLWSGDDTGYAGVLRYDTGKVECAYVYSIFDDHFPEAGSLPLPSVVEGLVQKGPDEGGQNEIIVWAHPRVGILKSVSPKFSGQCHLPDGAADVWCVEGGRLSRFVRHRKENDASHLVWSDGCDFPSGLMNWTGEGTRLLGLVSDRLGMFAGEFSQGDDGLIAMFVADLKSCEIKFASASRGMPARVFANQTLLVISHEKSVTLIDAGSGVTLAGPFATAGIVDACMVAADGVFIRIADKWFHRRTVDPFAMSGGMRELDLRLGPFSLDEVRSRWRARSQ